MRLFTSWNYLISVIWLFNKVQGLQLALAIPDRAVTDTLLLRNLKFLYQQDFPAIPDTPYYAQCSDRTMGLWKVIPWIIYKTLLLYRTTADKVKNIGTYTWVYMQQKGKGYRVSESTNSDRPCHSLLPPSSPWGLRFVARLPPSLLSCSGRTSQFNSDCCFLFDEFLLYMLRLQPLSAYVLLLGYC